MYVRNKQHQLLTGRDLDLSDLLACHPRLGYLTSRLDHLRTLATELTGHIAVRPQPPQFDALLQDVRQFHESIGSSERVLGFTQKLRSLGKALDRGQGVGSFQGTVTEVKAWGRTQTEFLKKMQRDYPFYSDLLIPFLAGVQQVRSRRVAW